MARLLYSLVVTHLLETRITYRRAILSVELRPYFFLSSLNQADLCNSHLVLALTYLLVFEDLF